MDTDDLTPMAYSTLSLAYDACEPMRAEIGMAARDYRTEDEYLRGIAKFLKEILEDPREYLESWNMEDEVDVKAFTAAVEGLLAHIGLTLSTPRAKRGKPPFET
ncbi:MAG: hypothetical protein Q7S40_08275 [Opitutaceae bacterium]|nr:hypothetical protein [Opitutaceae bacterium]